MTRHFRIAFLLLSLAAFALRGVAAQEAEPDLQRKPLDPEMMQIAIEAMVVEVNADRTRDLGIDYTYNRNEAEAPSNVVEGAVTRFPVFLEPVLVPSFFDDANALEGYRLGQAARTPGIGASLVGMDIGDVGRVSGNLRALMQQGEAEIRTNPIVVALNGTKANITTADEIPYQDVVYGKNSEANVAVNFRKVGVILEVTPRIVEPLEKQQVQISIDNLEVSGVSSYVTVRQVNRPLFATSKTNTKIVLHNAETLVISGLESKREAIVEDRLPYLGRIPLLGWLFKSQHKEIKDTRILFFITPYMLEPGVNAVLPREFNLQEAPDLSSPRSGRIGEPSAPKPEETGNDAP